MHNQQWEKKLSKILRIMSLMVFASSAAMLSTSTWAADPVKVRFSWKLKGEYGFFYLGKEKGLYQRNDVDLDLGEGAGAQAALGALVQGNEDVVIVPAIFAISAIQKGMPVKIAAIYQKRTPFAFISKLDNAVTKPSELEGRSLAVSVGDTATTYLGAFCKANKVDCSKIQQIQLDPQLKIPQFMQGRVDLITIYTNVDLPLIEQRTGMKFAVLDLPNFGLSVPGLAAVVSDRGIAERPDVLKRFLQATKEAIELTREDPASATAALLQAWSAGPSQELVQQQIVATSATLDTGAENPIGWISDDLINKALDLISTNEQIGERRPSSDFYTNELLEK
jgi:NitT/TauT family transport system substrate-binding protein